MFDKTESLRPAMRDQVLSFKHIDSLKTGDALRLKTGGKYNVPKMGDIVYVYQADTPLNPDLHSSSGISREDFTTVMMFEDDTLVELSLDSRYFERVSE